MHMEDIYQAGESTAEAMVSRNKLMEVNRCRPAMSTLLQLPSDSAVRGLIFAVPVSLLLWVILGLVVWAIVR